MPTFRNVSPLGDLEVTGVGFVEHGATFVVDDDAADGLAGQVENFELVADEVKAKSKSTDTTGEENA